MTRSEIDSLRQDSKAAMKLASDLVAKNIKPINFACKFYPTPKNKGGFYFLRRGSVTIPITTISVRFVANALKDVDSPQKGKFHKTV